VAIGGIAVSAFAIGPALLNGNVRNLGALLMSSEAATSGAPSGSVAGGSGD
jgi:hypothetical protein